MSSNRYLLAEPSSNVRGIRFYSYIANLVLVYLLFMSVIILCKCKVRVWPTTSLHVLDLNGEWSMDLFEPIRHRFCFKWSYSEIIWPFQNKNYICSIHIKGVLKNKRLTLFFVINPNSGEHSWCCLNTEA